MDRSYGETTAAVRAEHQHEKQAREWAVAKARLMDALESSNRASAELQDAQKAEQEHWDALVNLAGRGNPIPLPAPSPVGGGFQVGGFRQPLR